jgi:FAD/FMN-containing dehydrogenase
MQGYTLAMDFKYERSLLPFLEALDRIVLDHGGRLYLAKDARMSAQTFRSSYPRWEDFQALRLASGADRLFNSRQSQRLGL